MFYRKKIKELEKRLKDLEFDFGTIVGSERDRYCWNKDFKTSGVINNRKSLVNVVRTLYYKIK